MIGRPTEIFVRNPGPTHIRVGPVTIGIRTPTWIARCGRLPPIAVIADFDPISIGEIIVEEVDRDFGRACSLNGGQNKN